jgi:hypothetical protein
VISEQKYPALMTYIFARNLIPRGLSAVDRQAMKARGETLPLNWLEQLAVDSAEARAGGHTEALSR